MNRAKKIVVFTLVTEVSLSFLFLFLIHRNQIQKIEMVSNIKESKFVHLCFAISFFTSGLIINFIQCILFYGLKPFNKRLYRSIGYYLCYSFYSRKNFFLFSIQNLESKLIFVFFSFYRNSFHCRLVVKFKIVHIYRR